MGAGRGYYGTRLYGHTCPYVVMFMTKKAIKLSIDEDLITKAREIGLNISAFLENRLREFLDGENKTCGGRDSNPRTPTGVDLESTAFGLARQPPQERCDMQSRIGFLS